MSPLVKRLLARGLITRDVLPGLDSLGVDLGGTATLNILRAGLVDEDRLLDFICEQFEIPAVLQFEMEDLPKGVIETLPRTVAEAFRAIPVGSSGKDLEVVLSDPSDPDAISAIARATGKDVKPHAASESVISWALLKYYEVITPTLDEALARSTLARLAQGDDQAFLDEETLDEPIHLTEVIDEEPSLQSGVTPRPEPSVEILEGEVQPRRERISFSVIETDEKPDGPEIGNWDAPFELSRTLSSSPPDPSTPRRAMGPKDEEIPGNDDDALLLVEEDDWANAGAALEEEIEAHAGTDEQAIICDEPVTVQPIVVTRNVMLGQTGDADIIPPQPMTSRRAVDAIVNPAPRASSTPTPIPADSPSPTPDPARRGSGLRPLGTLSRTRDATLSGNPAGTPSRPPSAPGAPRTPGRTAKREGRIDASAVEAWKSGMGGLDTRDAVLDATLTFVDAVFGPALFLARKGNGLAGWNCSAGFGRISGEPVQAILLSPPSPREIWHAMERKRGMMGPISVKSEYPFLAPFMAPEHDAILVLPVIIGSIAAGAFVCMLRDAWTASPELKSTLESMGIVLSEKLEQILRNRKKSQR